MREEQEETWKGSSDGLRVNGPAHQVCSTFLVHILASECFDAGSPLCTCWGHHAQHASGRVSFSRCAFRRTSGCRCLS